MILNVFKPKYWTSFDVAAKTRSILSKKAGLKHKVGHCGTLDPLAEGVLIVLTDRDVKRQADYINLEKEYEADVAFGATTESFDLSEPMRFTKNQIPDLKTKLTPVFAKYIGEIYQVVPAFSAVKVNGQRLYKKAWKGFTKTADLPVRKVTIRSLELLEMSEREFEGGILPLAKIRIVCHGGTYIRALARDWGEDLGCGGVVASLLRTRVGDFTSNESVDISDLEKWLFF